MRFLRCPVIVFDLSPARGKTDRFLVWDTRTDETTTFEKEQPVLLSTPQSLRVVPVVTASRYVPILHRGAILLFLPRHYLLRVTAEGVEKLEQHGLQITAPVSTPYGLVMTVVVPDQAGGHNEVYVDHMCLARGYEVYAVYGEYVFAYSNEGKTYTWHLPERKAVEHQVDGRVVDCVGDYVVSILPVKRVVLSIGYGRHDKNVCVVNLKTGRKTIHPSASQSLLLPDSLVQVRIPLGEDAEVTIETFSGEKYEWDCEGDIYENVSRSGENVCVRLGDTTTVYDKTGVVVETIQNRAGARLDKGYTYCSAVVGVGRNLTTVYAPFQDEEVFSMMTDQTVVDVRQVVFPSISDCVSELFSSLLIRDLHSVVERYV